MKKVNIVKICNIVSIVLLVCFIVQTITDYTKYLNSFGSAPFYLWIAVNALCYVLPALIIFIVGIIIKMKNKK